MSDIAERLRQGVDPDNISETEQAMDAAAVEIERLRKLADDRREVANHEITSLMNACDTKDDEIERLRADLEQGMERFYSQGAELDNAKAEIERLRAEFAAERERCLKIAETPLTDEQCKQLNEGFGSILCGTTIYKLAQDTIAAAIRRGDKK